MGRGEGSSDVRGSATGRGAARAAGVGLALLLLASASPRAEEPAAAPVPAAEGEAAEPEGGASPADEPAPEPQPRKPVEQPDLVNLETPAFPGYRVRDAFRIRLGSGFLPAAGFDHFDADLYQPSVRVRATAPLSKRSVLQLTARFLASLYAFDGVTDFFGTGPTSGDPFDDFFRASLVLQGGFRLNESRSLFVEGEKWSLLGVAFGRSRWEEGAFGDALTGGGTLALGYEIEDRLRVALGVTVESRLDRGGARVGPALDLRWHVTDRFTVRNRGRGLQLEYELTPRFEVLLAAFYDSDKYLLDRRPGLPNDLTFRDQRVQAGAGFEWKLSRHFRMNLEAGAVAWRELRVRSVDDGNLSREKGDPSAYLGVRFEVRP
jgi:hypothetical protein